MFSPANGVGNYLAPEKIYCMSVLRILAFSPPELWGQKKIISKREGRRSRAPQDSPSYASASKYITVRVALYRS